MLYKRVEDAKFASLSRQSCIYLKEQLVKYRLTFRLRIGTGEALTVKINVVTGKRLFLLGNKATHPTKEASQLNLYRA